MNEQPLQTGQTIVQDHIDYLYECLVKLDLTDDHQHCMAHRIIDLITSVQEFHRDLDNPSSETKPSLAEIFLESLKRSGLFAEHFERGES